MKEKYNSEKQLKEAFEKFQMPIDNEAFGKFQQSLDNDKRKKRIIWWRRFGMILLPIILFFTVVLFTLDKHEDAAEVVLSVPQSHKSEPPAITNNHITNNSTVNTSLDSTKQIALKSKAYIDQNHDHFDHEKPNHISTRTLHTDDNNKNEYTPHYKQSSSNKDANSINGNQSTEIEQKTESSQTSMTPPVSQFQTKAPENSNRNTLDLIVPLPSLYSDVTYKRAYEQIDLSILPHREPFKKYFYFNLSTGIAINDNYGPSDNNFSVLNSKEIFLSSALAYQFSESHAFELSYSQFNHTTGYSSDIDPTYSNKQGFFVRIIKGSLVSKLWTPLQGFQISMTNGIASMFGKNESFSNRLISGQAPDLVKTAEIVSDFEDQKMHLMYSSGLQADYLLSKNLDCSFAANYTLGFKQRSYSRLRYLQGEGIYNNVESLSDGNFFAISLGLKYRFQ